MITLEQLKAFICSYATSSGICEYDIFDELGFFLIDPPENYGYDSTPTNSISFAATGGDGVHYGFIGEVSSDSPVVMTIPMAFPCDNIIVGENLYDFLCLGCCTSYFWLEQLAYDYEETVGILQQASDVFYGKLDKVRHEDCEVDINNPVFKSLRECFDLRPWEDVHARLEELKNRYLCNIVVEYDI